MSAGPSLRGSVKLFCQQPRAPVRTKYGAFEAPAWVVASRLLVIVFALVLRALADGELAHHAGFAVARH